MIIPLNLFLSGYESWILKKNIIKVEAFHNTAVTTSVDKMIKSGVKKLAKNTFIDRIVTIKNDIISIWLLSTSNQK